MIAVILLKVVWDAYRSGKMTDAEVESAAFTTFLVWVCARIFRTGILMYGKKPSLPEIVKWVRYK